jgi:hypothetical protein
VFQRKFLHQKSHRRMYRHQRFLLQKFRLQKSHRRFLQRHLVRL